MKDTVSPITLDDWELATKEGGKGHEGGAQSGEQNQTSRQTPGAEEITVSTLLYLTRFMEDQLSQEGRRS